MKWQQMTHRLVDANSNIANSNHPYLKFRLGTYLPPVNLDVTLKSVHVYKQIQGDLKGVYLAVHQILITILLQKVAKKTKTLSMVDIDIF